MRNRVRTFDWAGTPLGPLEGWPDALLGAVRLMLDATVPMCVWWGRELTTLYNDAYVPILAARHPSALAAAAPDVWRETWDVLGPQVLAVVERGEPVVSGERLLVMQRHARELTYFTCTYGPIDDGTGAVGGVVCTWSEDTSRVLAARHAADRTEADERAARALHDAIARGQALLSTLFEQAPVGVGLIDLGLRFTRLNPALAAMLGGSPEGLLGRTLATVAAQTVPALLPAVEHVLATGEALRGVRLEVRSPSGDGRCLRASLARVEPTPGSTLGVTLVVEDVTDHERNAAALREAGARKDEFLAMLAHELRNPLAPIRAVGGLLGRLGVDSPKISQARGIIERQVAQLSRLVDDLLDVSRMTRGQVALHREPLALAAAVAAAVEAVRPLLERHGHALTVSLPAEPLWVEGDFTRLVQVLSNLLGNAVKFTPARGRISVGLVADGTTATIRVRDSGLGIAPDLLPRIFEPFVQADGGLARTQGGLGVGLTLARRLIELHGGRVEASSDGPGSGSEFLVHLPLVPAPPELAPAQIIPAVPVRHRRVLVVEDNPDAAESFRMLLEHDGHEVRVASDGLAAVREVEHFVPHVAFIDLGLPGIDGFELAPRLRATSACRDTLMVALTGYGRDEDRLRASEAGFDQHLTKPVSMDALTALLASTGSRVQPTQRH